MQRRIYINTIKRFFKEKEIPIQNILSAATDGVPAMTGRHKGFIAHLKQAVLNVLTGHCVIHSQHLIAKNLSERLHTLLHYVLTAVNKIRNTSLSDMNDFNRLLLHTEVLWLSKGICLSRFYNLFDSVIEFLEFRDNVLRQPDYIKK